MKQMIMLVPIRIDLEAYNLQCLVESKVYIQLDFTNNNLAMCSEKLGKCRLSKSCQIINFCKSGMIS